MINLMLNVEIVVECVIVANIERVVIVHFFTFMWLNLRDFV